MKQSHTAALTRAALSAAAYAALTLLTPALSYGPVQFRIAEALTVLPFFSPVYIAGITVGCLISNLLSPALWTDVVFGTLATLVGAVGTWICGKLKKPYLAPLPPVLSNTLIVSAELTVLSGVKSTYLPTCLTVLIGEAVACYGLGLLLMKLIKRIQK